MKKIFAFTLIIALATTIGCKKSLKELNVNPNAPSASVNPNYLFTYSVESSMGDYITDANLHYWDLMTWDMYFGTLDGSLGYITNSGKDTYWNEVYASGLENAHQVILLTQDSAQAINKTSIARIWQVFLYQRLTDLFGEIPYSQALTALENLNYTPTYDRQDTIYMRMIRELNSAASALDSTKPTFPGVTDPIYNGSVSKWRKFANSLHLRMAIRMRNVNPTQAQKEITSLLNKPMISSNSESAIFPYNTTTQNPLAALIASNQGGAYIYPSKFLIDMLKNTNDPRLTVFAQPTVQSILIGVPDYEGVPNLVPPSDSKIWSQYNSNGTSVSLVGTWFTQFTTPGVLMSYAEVDFLKAEAALMILSGSWSTSTAQQLYVQGVDANLNSYTGSGISSSAISTYETNLPAVSLQNIITQKWLSFTFENGYEAYAEYRRTYYPVLTDTTGNAIDHTQFPNRLTYPTTEAQLNSASYNTAVSQQGADIPSTKMWWDNFAH